MLPGGHDLRGTCFLGWICACADPAEPLTQSGEELNDLLQIMI